MPPLSSPLAVLNQAPVFAAALRYQSTLLPASGITSGWADKTSLAQAADGSLFIAYAGDTGAVVAHQAGTGWQQLLLPDFADASYVRMASGGDGVPYVLLMKMINDVQVAKVFSWQNNTWVAVGGTLDVANIDSPLIAGDSSGTPYVTYTDADTGGLGVMRFTGGAWDKLATINIPGLSGNYDLQLTPAGVPYIAFADGQQGNKLTVMQFDGTNWGVVGAAGFSPISAQRAHVAVNGTEVYAVYGDDRSGMQVSHFDGTTWTTLPALPSIFQPTALPYELTVGADGALYLVAKTVRAVADFHLLRYAEGAWTLMTTDRLAATELTTVIMGANGHLYASYFDSSNDNNTTKVYELEAAVPASAVTTSTAVKLAVSDPDSDPLVFTLAGGRDQALFEVANGGIRFITKPTAAGIYTVRVTVDDGTNQVTRLVNVAVSVPPNSAPVLDPAGSPKLPDAALGGLLPTGPVGVRVADLLGSSVSDVDGNPAGMVVTGVNGGTLHYSLDGGTHWVAVTDTVQASHALLLSASTRVYFEAAAGTRGSLADALTVRAWDGTDGVSGSWLDLSGRVAIEGQAASSGALDLVTVGNLVLQATPAGLAVYDPAQVSTPAGILNASVAGLIAVAAGKDFVYAIGTGAGGGASTLLVASIATPNAPSEVYTLDMSGQLMSPTAVAAYGDTVVVGSSDQGVWQIKVDAAGTPTMDSARISAAAATTLAIDATRIVIGNGTTGLTLIDRTTSVTTTLNFADLPGVGADTARDIVIQGNYAFVAAGSGLLIADVTDLSAPRWLVKVPLTGTSERVAVVGERAFVISSGAVQMIDITDVANPVVGTPIDIASGTAITVAGTKLVITTDGSLNVVASGALPGSVSRETDIIAVDVVDPNVPPVVVTPGPTPAPSTPIDGVPVLIGTGTDGQPQLTVPMVTPGRTEDPSTPNGKLADIAVVKSAGGTILLSLGVPEGTGLTSGGPTTPVSGSNAQSLLDTRIGTSTASAELKSAGQNFLGSLPTGTEIVIQTITPTAQAGNGPLVIAATPGAHKTALIIDSRALPTGALIDLRNVDFAIIVGNARVVGGAGANVVYGDGLDQFIVLGEGDDILHGGGGQDTVGSLRGNDQTFGDAGNDVVYGGTGNDTLHGGAGNDRMNGGFGLDTGVQSGVLGDYTVTVDGRAVVLTHKTSAEVDRFIDVEHIVFDSGNSLIVAHTAGDVAGLTAQFAGAQVIELNANRAVGGTAASDDITPELGMALNIDLGAGVDIVRLAGARADVHIDVEAGQRAELTRLADGAMLAFNNVELLAFANGNVTVLAHNHQEAVIGRAYELLLDRNVDTGGFAFWIAGVQSGVSLKDTLSLMMQSPEYTGASLSNSAFVELLYANGFGRTADVGGKAFWVGALDTGVSRAQVLEGFASSAEAVTVIGSTIDVTVVS